MKENQTSLWQGAVMKSLCGASLMPDMEEIKEPATNTLGDVQT